VRPNVPRLLILVTAALVLAGCHWNDQVDSKVATYGLPTLRQDLEANDWLLDRADSSLTVPDGNPVTLTFRGDTVSGMAPCNDYHGRFALDDDSVEIGPLAVTRRACAPSTMRAEDEFFRALQGSTRAHQSGDRLVLTNGGTRLSFQNFVAADALAGEWSVTDVGRGDALSSVIAGSGPTVTFHPDETLTLSTGCNTATSSWQLDGDALAVDHMRLTLKQCDQPAGVMDQETALVSALQSASRVDIAPGRLFVLDDAGRIALVAVRNPAS
jgi:heat shock protein HslJ